MSEGKARDYICQVPVELLHMILRQLSAQSLLSCRYINRRFRYAVSTMPEHSTYMRYLTDILRLDGQYLKRTVRNRHRASSCLLQSVRDSFDYFGLNFMERIYTEAYANANTLDYDACFPPASTRYTQTLRNLALFMHSSDFIQD